jgi:hypothetical protein
MGRKDCESCFEVWNKIAIENKLGKSINQLTIKQSKYFSLFDLIKKNKINPNNKTDNTIVIIFFIVNFFTINSQNKKWVTELTDTHLIIVVCKLF